MAAGAVESTPGGAKVVLPWVDGRRTLSRLGVAVDALAVGIVNARKQQLDEFLAVRGWSVTGLGDWLARDISTHRVTGKLRRRGGIVTGRSDELARDDPLSQFQHFMTLLIPDAAELGGSWCLLLGRDGSEFNRDERQVTALSLSCWQVAFDQVSEPGMGRMLIGHDYRLIHADPRTRLRILEHPEMQSQLLDLLHPVVEQRWPGLRDGELHDFAIELAGRTWWIRFRRDRAIDVEDGEYWYVELRDLTGDDLPPVGMVEDERIGRALAYLHDGFDRSPSLTDVARSVHISPFHFHRLFSRIVGISPKQYLQRKQLQMAKWLLRASRQPIGSIAGRTGFASHGHFTSTFHRMVGVSPRRYRESAE